MVSSFVELVLEMHQEGQDPRDAEEGGEDDEDYQQQVHRGDRAGDIWLVKLLSVQVRGVKEIVKCYLGSLCRFCIFSSLLVAAF